MSEVVSADLPGRGRTCFVIGPIGNRHAPVGSAEHDVYVEALRVIEQIIEPACKTVGLEPVRADGISKAGEINDQIFRRLRDDDVVIADLTNANANVMYELGLRHTKDRITLQIGEYGRLPFDINQIRTVQFSGSDVGRSDASKELAESLGAALGGEFDPVSATRVWFEEAPTATPATIDVPAQLEDDRGFLDVLADAEEQIQLLPVALNAIQAHVEKLGDLAVSSTSAMESSDQAGRGMKGRVQVAARYASGIDAITPELKQDIERYESVLSDVSAGNLALIGQLEEDPERLEDPNSLEFAYSVRATAAVTRDSMASLSELVASINDNARMSRVLRTPSADLAAALNRFIATTEVIDEWDRRLQALGVSMPPKGWSWDESAEGDSDLDDAEPN